MELDIGASPMAHPALRNSLVLLKIFDQLSLEDVKQIRRVCSDWENAASSTLGKFTAFNVKSFLEHFQGRPVGVPLQLLRRIAVDGIQSVQGSNLEKDSFLNFLQTHSDWIQEMFFSLDWAFAPAMKNLFQNLVFLKLKKVSIQEIGTVADVDAEFPEPENLCFQKIPHLTKLLELELDASAGEKANTLETGHRYLALFQGLINNSPNLEKLATTGNIYPDLTSAVKLKSFRLTLFPVKFDLANSDADPTVRPDFSMERVEEMLSKVSNTLEELNLMNVIPTDNEGWDGTEEWDGYDTLSLKHMNWDQNVEPRISRLPYFPKLKSLKIQDLNGFLEEFSFSQNKFPSLTKLDLTGSEYGSNNYFENFVRTMGPQDTVNEFKFNIIFEDEEEYDHFRSLPLIIQNFPNLAKLDVRWGGLSGFPDSFNSVEWMKELKKFHRLEHLTLRFECDLTLSQLMGGIGAVGFEGLKTLHLVAIEEEYVKDDNCINFDTVFRAIPKITFEGFDVKFTTHNKMQEFFQPSEFKDRIKFI